MSPGLAFLAAMAVLFVAALIKSTFGFGESLLAIPLLTLILGIQTAAPLVSLIAGTITVVIVVQNWQRMEFQTTWQLILAAAIGVPVGVWGLSNLPEQWLRVGMGLLLIGVSIYHLIKPNLGSLHSGAWAYLFGFTSGMLGGAYNMASPPVILYGAMRRWSSEQFRVMLQGFFLPVSILILAGHAGAGLWTRQVLGLFALSIPLMVIAYWLGTYFNRTMSTEKFERFLYGGLIVVGIMLLV